MDTTLFSPFYDSKGICTDTRSIFKDCLFICIKGESFDGNTFAAKALEAGAKHVIVDNKDFFDASASMTLIDDSVQYLQQLALFHRNKFDIPVIGITGSNGKTTTKELIHAVLSKKYKVLATKGNLNNHLGVPFTLLGLDASHEIAIIEMGANRFKDIEELCAIARPNYGIITNIGKAHLEGFLSFEGVLKTKRELYEAVESVGGTLVVNADDPVLVNILPESLPTFTYGTEQAAVQGEMLQLTPFVNMEWKSDGYESGALQTQMIGKYNFYNYLAAAAFGSLFNVPNDAISAAITEYAPTNNRSQVQKSASNTLILDCYNANPTSMKSALESFALIDHPNKQFIIGDMKELGHDSELEHRAIATLCEALKLNGITVGTSFQQIPSPSFSQQFKDAEGALVYLEQNTPAEALLLLKGSRSIRLELLIKAL